MEIEMDSSNLNIDDAELAKQILELVREIHHRMILQDTNDIICGENEIIKSYKNLEILDYLRSNHLIQYKILDLVLVLDSKGERTDKMLSIEVPNKEEFAKFHEFLKNKKADEPNSFWFDGKTLKIKRKEGGTETFKLAGDVYLLMFALIELLKAKNPSKEGLWLRAEIKREDILEAVKKDREWLKNTIGNLKRALKEHYEDYIFISTFNRSKGTYVIGLKLAE